VNSALLSRCQVYVLKPLNEDDLGATATPCPQHRRGIKKREGYAERNRGVDQDLRRDARKLLNLLEVVCNAADKSAVITDELVMEIAQQRVALYDKKGEQHYDIISAFIKCIRGAILMQPYTGWQE